MPNLWVEETFCEVTTNEDGEEYNTIFSEGDAYETFAETKGELYKANVKEHGRCTGKVHIEEDGQIKDIGWVFRKRAKYEDSNDTYLQDVWVVVMTGPPKTTREYFYA